MEIQEVTQEKNEFIVEDDPIMQCATDALMQMSPIGKIYIITDNFLKDNSRVAKINLDSEISHHDGRMISNIEIFVVKN